MGNSKQAAFGDYATLLEILERNYKQESVNIPMKMTTTKSGEVKREEFFPCPDCTWISCSKAEVKRHNICFHSSEPLEEIRKKMVALAMETGDVADSAASNLQKAKAQLKGTLDDVQPLDAKKQGGKGPKKRPAAAKEFHPTASFKVKKAAHKDTIDDEADHTIAKVTDIFMGCCLQHLFRKLVNEMECTKQIRYTSSTMVGN